VRQARILLTQLRDGTGETVIKTNDGKPTKFFLLGLSPNASRISVRVWVEADAAELQRRLGQHLRDIALVLRGHRDWFDPILSEAGLGDYTWHCNRHTFASRFVMAGVNLRLVQELTGHRSLTMVARYSHLAPGHHQSAVELIASRDWSTLGSPQSSVATQSATSKNAEVG
jgi:integrase